MTDTAIDRPASRVTPVLRSPALWLGVAVGALELMDADPFDPRGGTTYVLPLLALSYLIFAVVRHGSRRPTLVRVQIAGVLGFTALALLALVVDPVIGRYVIAAGWLAHGIWDLAHRDGRVVPTWYVWFCAPVDVMIAVSLAIGPFRE